MNAPLAAAQSRASTAQVPSQPPQSGISSAGNFAPVYDAEKRPITAGGFVDKDKGTVVFEDATKSAGLSNWRHVMGTLDKKYILETDGSGVGLIDYDNDGWLDIYIVNGSQRPHFGLGDATDAGTAEIHWPSGAVETVKLPAEDRIFTITEGKGITAVLCARQPCIAKPVPKAARPLTKAKP
jgi:hypothetical protein